MVDVEGQFDKLVASLPVATYRAGETVIASGAKSGQLLILKNGQVVVLKDSVEIARVAQRGAVFGELSALLDQPHTADVRALEDSQFSVGDATLLDKEPIAMCYVAKILALRIIDANKNFVELKGQIKSGSSSGALSKAFGKLEAILSIGGAGFET
jgi:CRP/FNR family cyclic AMP-dependent transcriptional regulator